MKPKDQKLLAEKFKSASERLESIRNDVLWCQALLDMTVEGVSLKPETDRMKELQLYFGFLHMALSNKEIAAGVLRAAGV